MERLFLLLISCGVSSPGQNSLSYFFTLSPGVQTLPEFMIVATVNDVELGYCDSSNNKAQPRQDWVKLFEDDPDHLEWNTKGCLDDYWDSKKRFQFLTQQFNQTEGVHTLQNVLNFYWDDETDDFILYQRFGFDGDSISMDLNTRRWIFTEKSVEMKGNRANMAYNSDLVESLSWRLKKYLHYGKSFLYRKDLPSVSLLQKTPSSPVSCHATGFYPDRAEMFWRKDGEQLHEDVDRGEILPNHDGTFQMSVDLKLSSVQPEDWRRYDCVFQLSGVKEDIITNLDKSVIRSNREEPHHTIIPVVMTVISLVVIIIIIKAVFVFHRKKALSSELTDRLNPET